MAAVRNVCDMTSLMDRGTMLFNLLLVKRLCSRQVALPVRGDLPLHQIPLAKLENIQQQGIKEGALNISWIWGHRHICGMYTSERFGP